MADIVPISERPNRARALALINRCGAIPDPVQDPLALVAARPLMDPGADLGEEDSAASDELDRLDSIYGEGAASEQ